MVLCGKGLMRVEVHISEAVSVKRGLNSSAKSVYPDQPVQSTQDDLGQIFLAISQFSAYHTPAIVCDSFGF